MPFMRIVGARHSAGVAPRRKARTILLHAAALRAAVLVAFAASVALAGCASIEPQGEPSFKLETPPLPPRPPKPDSEASAEHNRMVALFDGEYKDPAAERYLNDILAKLAKADDRRGEPYKVTILDSPIVNAFALPPHDLFITRGLLALANDASEVAAVMAHEIAHLTAKHAVRREEEEKRAAVISRAASIVQNKEKGQEIEASARRTIATFSRQQELDADQMGIKAIAKAGFDPYGASRFLGALGRSAALRTSLIGQNASADKPDILATHPSTPERVTQAIAVARQIAAPGIGVTDRNAYLSAIDGMVFGDSPTEGTARGRSFLHARLGFAFLAPEGFVLENASKALLGVSSDGNQALRLDSVKAPPDMSLEAYMASDWIDGLEQGSIETIDVNGAPAVIARAKAGDWSFRLAVIRFEPGEFYRLIFATRIESDESQQRFKDALYSFHRASPEEIRAVRPLRIEIVTAKPGERPQDFAEKMATPDRTLEFFRLINGLEASAPLQAGERYKIVVEQN
ncbi:Zn-dependent protease [Methylocella silvestris]|uniref:Zn-dependent protease n=2 Tax=Methylocella silvestris TaxID=199596 RepID=A0A2J7TJZ0_METSI|nr:M48 family metalloprotease [Methylocella silvestris]PNG27085.1 Zn-dependent protease [Methylocella silvestris]